MALRRDLPSLRADPGLGQLRPELRARPVGSRP
jgi:hypothetical protein